MFLTASIRSQKKRAKAHLEKKNAHKKNEERHVTRVLLLDGIRKRRCMSKIWRPKTLHKDEAQSKNYKTRNMPKNLTLHIPAVQSPKCTISAIVTCSSTNIETCRSLRPYKTNKTTHTCHATHLVNDARIFKLILTHA